MRVALADDSALFRNGLAALLTAAGHLVVHRARSGLELEALLRIESADVAVIDIRMPPTFTDEGIETAHRLHAAYPSMGVLTLSTYVQADYAIRLLGDSSGGVGYLLKDRVGDIDVLVDALTRLCAGESVIDAEIGRVLMSMRRIRGPVNALSDRERDVLQAMAQGRSNNGIATDLHLSPKTVEAHTAAVFSKLGLHAHAADNRRVLAVLMHLRAAAASDPID